MRKPTLTSKPNRTSSRVDSNVPVGLERQHTSGKQEALGDINEEWSEFSDDELEDGFGQGYDPATKSRIICFNKCLVGPAGSNSPIVTSIINIMMIGFNILTLAYTLRGSWYWAISLNIFIGMMA